MIPKPDEPSKCQECSGLNKQKVTDSDWYQPLEIETECTACGLVGFWAHGYFMTDEAKI